MMTQNTTKSCFNEKIFTARKKNKLAKKKANTMFVINKIHLKNHR